MFYCFVTLFYVVYVVLHLRPLHLIHRRNVSFPHPHPALTSLSGRIWCFGHLRTPLSDPPGDLRTSYSHPGLDRPRPALASPSRPCPALAGLSDPLGPCPALAVPSRPSSGLTVANRAPRPSSLMVPLVVDCFLSVYTFPLGFERFHSLLGFHRSHLPSRLHVTFQRVRRL